MNIKIAGIVKESIVDGSGIRYVIFTQGCPHNCEGCHNPSSHSYEGGSSMSISLILSEIDKNPLLSGVTVSGGEPMIQAEVLIELAKQIKARGLSLIIYSGYTIEEIMELGGEKVELLKLCDELIDGRFILAQRDLRLKFRGSTNQRVIDLKEYFKQMQ